MAEMQILSESQEFGRWGQQVPAQEFGRGFPQPMAQGFGRWGQPVPAQEFGRTWPLIDQGWRSPREVPPSGRHFLH